jgi:GAF domain-containing protein
VLAADQLRELLEPTDDLIHVAESGAEYFRELLDAATVTVSQLVDGRYRDLVVVGDLPPGEERHPPAAGYPQAEYPIATEALRVQGGYFGSGPEMPVFAEFVEALPLPEITSVMGVSIMSGGVARGEICLTRAPGGRDFDREDFELVRDLATVFGTQLLIALGKRLTRPRHRPRWASDFSVRCPGRARATLCEIRQPRDSTW